jgi:competence protein ComEC
VVALCLAAGCAAARWLPPCADATGAASLWGCAAAALGAWCWLLRRGDSRRAAFALGAAVACAGGAWSAARFDLFGVDDLAWQLTEHPAPVAIRGTVVEAFRRLPTADPVSARTIAIGPSSECVVALEAVRDGRRWRPASGRAAVIVEGDPPAIPTGSRVRVLGRGLRPGPALNPGEFDSRLRARSLRCLSIVRVSSAASVRLVARPTSWSLASRLDAVRGWGVGVLQSRLAADRAALAAALLLGSRESLPREEADDFLVTGTVHVLSISGLHVGLLSLALFAAFRTLAVPRAWALAAVAGCTGAYMLLVRAETPVVRATLLVWLACLAAATGRRSPAINALAAAAVVVLAWRPAEVFSTGAQLSFLSTGVLVGVAAALPQLETPSDPIDRLIERSRSPVERRVRRLTWQAWAVFLSGAVVWGVTAPAVAARFHLVSPVGLVLNVLIAPLVAAAMAAGFLCLLAAAVAPPLAVPCGAACDAALAAIGWLVTSGAAIPGGHLWLPGPPPWWVAGWYAFLAGSLLTLAPAVLRRPRTWLVLAGAWSVVGIVAIPALRLVNPAPQGLRVIAAAMGHGCGIVVRSPAGRCLVYDAGRLGAASAARRAISAVLWSEGIARIDTLVISHADADHMNAVPELLERFCVGELAVGEAFVESDAFAVRDLLARAAARGVTVRRLRSGDSFAVDPLCRARVLHADPAPGAPSPRDRDNETSLVVAIDAAGRRLLLTGDLEGRALARFVTAEPGPCDVLVAPHHGSRTSLPPDIARATTPAWVVVSGAGGASWPEVRAAYEAATPSRSAAVLKTGGEGAIALAITAGAVTVERFAGGRWRPVAPPISRPPPALRPQPRDWAGSAPPPPRSG